MNLFNSVTLVKRTKHLFDLTLEYGKTKVYIPYHIIDVLGPLATCTGEFKYQIVAIDDLTKWVEAKPITNLTA